MGLFKKASSRLLAVLSLITVLLFAYQNCGKPGFHARKVVLTGVAGLSSMEVCEQILVDAYNDSYFPILSSSGYCNRCHSDAHGSKDFQTSYDAFLDYGADLIDSRASNPHGGNGLDLSNEIVVIRPIWNQGVAAFEDCVAEKIPQKAQ